MKARRETAMVTERLVPLPSPPLPPRKRKPSKKEMPIRSETNFRNQGGGKARRLRVENPPAGRQTRSLRSECWAAGRPPRRERAARCRVVLPRLRRGLGCPREQRTPWLP